MTVGGGSEITVYGFIDYLRSLGIEKSRIKALHLYGGSRLSLVDHAELLRIGDRIGFSFTQGDRGKPRVEWPAVKLHVNTTIEMLSSVAVYVDKDPPMLGSDGKLVLPDGTPVDGKVPYAPEEQGNGTRIYVDGALVGTVKRKKITNDMLATDASQTVLGSALTPQSQVGAKNEAASIAEDRFSLLAYANKLRSDATRVQSIDLLAGDDVVARLGSGEARSLTFNVPARNRGQAMVDVPSTSGTHKTSISAVQIYVKSKPPSRTVVPLNEASQASLGPGRMDGQGGPFAGQGGGGSTDEL
jgi:hypothetical protein